MYDRGKLHEDQSKLTKTIVLEFGKWSKFMIHILYLLVQFCVQGMPTILDTGISIHSNYTSHKCSTHYSLCCC